MNIKTNKPIEIIIREELLNFNEDNENGKIDNNVTGKIANGNENGKIANDNENGKIDNNVTGKIVNGNENGKIAETIIREEYYNMNSIPVWHGSTKKFDDFDMSMVGTGDNSSLGGWGIYFSDNKAVSMRYFLPAGQIRQYRLQSGEYFDLDNAVDQSETSRMFKMLQRLNTSEKDLAEFDENYIHTDYPPTNKNLYDWLSFVLKSEKNASLFLDKLGYIGNTMEDRWERGARNYIVFDIDAIMGEVENDYGDENNGEYNDQNNNNNDNPDEDY